jgi:hypothetical protein
MNKTRREIECLDRMMQLHGSLDELLAFLQAESLMTADDIRVFKLNAEQPKTLQKKLSLMSLEGKLQLLEYEWTLLPVERIKILIVTNRNSKEFSYNF